MRKYKTRKKMDYLELESVTCDICGKTYFNSDNIGEFEIQEFLYFNNICGYGSVFGDETKISLDICQHCLKEKLGEYIKEKK